MISLLNRYKNIRAESEQICKPLQMDDYMLQPADFVSPPKWSLAHTTWFFEAYILKPFVGGYEEFHPGFDYLFNGHFEWSGKGLDRAMRGSLARPTTTEVYEYRKHVDRAMERYLKHLPEKENILKRIEIALNHEQQHQELLYADLKYAFSLNPLIPTYHKKVFVEDIEIAKTEWIKITGGVYSIGYHGEEFCYANELSRHKVYLHPYEIRSSLVSNAEFLEFILDNGYSKFEYWQTDGWNWLQENKIKHPMYWYTKDNHWFQYTLAGVLPLNPLNPLTHVSYYEAAAFANWKKLRLPTEFEWEASCKFFNYGHRWEWTDSSYLPYPGYESSPFYPDQNHGRFMVNQKVLRGGSVVSSKGHVRNTYRLFLRPNEAWHFNGIRLAR